MTNTVNLSDAAGCGVYSAGTLTSSGASVIAGDVYANTVVGFPPGVVTAGFALTAAGDSAAVGACVLAAYDEAVSLPATSPLAAELSGLTYTPGVYACASAAAFTSGVLHLDGAGTYVFKVAGGLGAAAGVSVSLENGATSADVWWVVTGAVTVGAGAHLEGTFLCGAAMTLGAGVTVNGRLLAPLAAITMDGCALTRPAVVDPAVAAAALAVLEQGHLADSTTDVCSFTVEYPDGSVLACAHHFGDDMQRLVRDVASRSECCSSEVRWQLTTEAGGVVSHIQALRAVTPEQQPLHVAPRTEEHLRLRVRPVRAVPLVIKLRDRTLTLDADERFTVRFYQRRIRCQSRTGDCHVWLDGNGDFIDPSSLVGSIVNPVSIATCDAATLSRTQLPV